MSAEVQDLAVRCRAAWAARDLDAITALHTEDTVFGVDVFSVSDGLVARKDTYLDWAAVQRQTSELAATPA